MKLQTGFTMIELLVTVAVVGILAAIALPSYTTYVQRGNITEATSNLAGLRVGMEQWYQDNRTYLNGAACGVAMPSAPTVKFFTFACAGTATTYTITATGTGSMAGFTYTIDQSNTKQTTAAPAGWAAAAMPTACWITKQGGAC